MKVTPSDETATYYCGIHSEASLLGIPTATLLRQIASLDDLDERLHTGTEEFTIAETLTPVTSYKIVVAGYDGKGVHGRHSPERSLRRRTARRACGLHLRGQEELRQHGHRHHAAGGKSPTSPR